MKKVLIVIVIIIAVIIAGLVITDIFFPQAAPKIEQAAQNDSALATDAGMKSLTAQVMVMVLKYDETDTTNTVFMKVPANVTALNALLTQFGQQNGINITPSIISSASGEVIKLQVAGENSFYCTDTSEANGAITSVPVSGDNFTSSTDCAGQPIQ